VCHNCSSHALTADVDIKQTAHAAELFLSDGVIVTGTSTGMATDLHELRGKSRHLYFKTSYVNLLIDLMTSDIQIRPE